jgi:transposase
MTCILANAAHIAQVPGRKTDVKDCVWIAQLVEHGLVRGASCHRLQSETCAT